MEIAHRLHEAGTSAIRELSMLPGKGAPVSPDDRIANSGRLPARGLVGTPLFPRQPDLSILRPGRATADHAQVGAGIARPARVL